VKTKGAKKIREREKRNYNGEREVQARVPSRCCNSNDNDSS